jgi:DNA-binding transcriptional ArsR family regulator
MGLTKTANFTERQNQLAQLLKALAHPARIAIIDHLIRANECITGDLVDVLGLSQATTSQHLRELKEVGLLKGTIEGNAMNYCIDQVKWKEYAAILSAFFIDVKFDETCC